MYAFLAERELGNQLWCRRLGEVLQEKGKRCQIVCSSGVACGEYHGFAVTVHSHYGLQIAELPQNLLLACSLERLNIVEKIKNVDVLIWDEISMSSQRLLNIINLLHQETSKSSFPFRWYPSHFSRRFLASKANPKCGRQWRSGL